MDGCEYSIETIISPLKEYIARIKAFFRNKHTTADRNTQTMDDKINKFSCQNKYSALQRMDDCNSFCNKVRYTNSRAGCLQLDW